MEQGQSHYLHWQWQKHPAIEQEQTFLVLAYNLPKISKMDFPSLLVILNL